MTDTCTNKSSSRRPRRMARMPYTVSAVPDVAAVVIKTSKLNIMQTLLCQPGGTTLAELVASTGWQKHSVRGAMAGALRKRGLIVSSDKLGGARRYRAGDEA